LALELFIPIPGKRYDMVADDTHRETNLAITIIINPMGKFIKFGRVVLVLNGRYAGRKGVVVKTYDQDKEKKFSYALVAGVDRYPRKVTKVMGRKKIARRIRIKPFVKFINLNHLLPTRYQVTGDIDFKTLVADDKMKDATKRREMKKALKLAMEEKYQNLPTIKSSGDKANHLKFFFKKLRF